METTINNIRISPKVSTELFAKSHPIIIEPTKRTYTKHLTKLNATFNTPKCQLFTYGIKGKLIDKDGNKIPYKVLLSPKNGNGIIKITQPIIKSIA